ncbi:MAG: pyridoxal 5'-phosphate synthase, partial [Acidobacteriota bacterium]
MSDSRSDEHATGPMVVGGGDTAQLDLSQIRREYASSNLRRAHLDDNPIDQFGAWMHDAVESPHPEPTAMTLATIGEDGMPAARVVLLKGFDTRGFRFFTNYQSRKGRELDAHLKASVCFFWPELHRQVRIDGTIERVDRDESADYFQTRPHASQVSAMASPQSRPVQDRAELERRHREIQNQ